MPISLSGLTRLNFSRTSVAGEISLSVTTGIRALPKMRFRAKLQPTQSAPRAVAPVLWDYSQLAGRSCRGIGRAAAQRHTGPATARQCHALAVITRARRIERYRDNLALVGAQIVTPTRHNPEWRAHAGRPTQSTPSDIF